MGFFNKLLGKPGKGNENSIYAPVAGRTVPLCEVPDPAFSGGMLGDGVAIIPAEGKIYAPCNATVDMVFTTGHAVTLVADSGAEILIHVGLQANPDQNKYFTVHIQNGQRVEKGTLMIEVDLEAMAADGLRAITPVLVSNCDEFGSFRTLTGKTVSNEDIILELAR